MIFFVVLFICINIFLMFNCFRIVFYLFKRLSYNLNNVYHKIFDNVSTRNFFRNLNQIIFDKKFRNKQDTF